MKDFLYDDSFDFLIKDGDLVVGNVENQAAQELLEADKGWYFFDQTVGAGLVYYLNDDIGAGNAFVGIRKGLEADGMSIQNLDFVGENLQLEFEYNKRFPKSTVKGFSLSGKNKVVDVSPNQSIFDLALIYYGATEAVWNIMDKVGAVDFPPVMPYQTIQVDVLLNNTGDLYERVSMELATILDVETRGIGYWRIEQDFKIT
ncbi:hypothetical protein VB796_20950 [Arcicella sp. LKC2W]|uniref:hypothetical protein n=1 Tax=Arcicella sp. LKC2W TaxID=2984198 RepID=UPI002B1EB0C2|nr:hypothetical protein [Arcicella sp. LKC2W]MEA5461548.1 hypothetical protein [Arcicella sp. LKC2W]